MNFKKGSIAGGRNIAPIQPKIVESGFTLDTENQNFRVGDYISAGTLMDANEETRKATVLKSAKVKAVSGTKVTVDAEFLIPLFVVGDSVGKQGGGTFADAPTVTAVDENADNVVITLSAAISGLSAGDSIYQLVADGANAKIAGDGAYLVAVDCPVLDGYTPIDAAREWTVYEHRIPPLPPDAKTDVFLTKNPNIQFSQSF